LSPEASTSGQTRNFNDEDLQVLRTVKVLRDRNLSYDEIEGELRSGVQPAPAESPEPSTALITMAQVQMMIAPISAAADEWRAIADDRRQEVESLRGNIEVLQDGHRQDLEALREENRRLREELAAERLPWWRRLLGR